ncbi:MAG: nitrous oxide reductase accessory protein NosL [Candidatus Eremiobacteraeota bacterium]|nr:nitrous oxide reductase accessory protein NosL [Candidatus Eremiobacteraeota bacterium]
MKPEHWILAACLLAGCARTASPPQPPDLKLGEMNCSRCGMSIDDGRFAAARQVGGVLRLYDDAGEMFLERKQSPAADEYLWVRDYNDQKWLDGRTCRYLRGSKIRSPMGFQVAATADELAAAPLAARWGCQVLDLETLQNQWNSQEEKQP